MARKTDAALYVGAVMHQRFAPRRHRLRYAMFQVLFDIDETPNLARRLRLFSHNAFNIVSFHDRDHGDGRESPLRGWVEETLGRAGMPIEGGRILLLCMPRILGHVFNPLSIYFCHDRDGGLTAMLYEVNNTFGERHSYLIPVSNPAERPIRQSCAKAFHVSPFMDMTMTYDFQITRPEDADSRHDSPAHSAAKLARTPQAPSCSPPPSRAHVATSPTPPRPGPHDPPSTHVEGRRRHPPGLVEFRL